MENDTEKTKTEENNDSTNENVMTEQTAEEEIAVAAAGAASTADGVAGIGAGAGTGTGAFVGEVLPRKKKRGYLFIKRVFDILSSGIMLILLSWLILLCLLIKWLEDFHNPVYVSKRVGKDGKIFNFYKIRTMRPNAEQLKQQLIDQGLNEADGPAFKMKNDPRITKVGKFYRKFSIDELLQLINVFNGTMSVVGPRPPLPKEVAEYTEEQKHRLDVKGGLLCLWQIQKNRNAITFDDWVKLDLEYIEKRSVGLDLKIIFKGAWMVIFDHSGE
jgi:lipopolysaccharide/colanic/teichoic acid biosynthesis glycosyltransferase